jgi:CDP-paratose 2-epimerase
MHVLVTGSNGLIGSEAVTYFDALGCDVVGVDNNMRSEFFGPDGDTRWNQRRLLATTRRFRHVEADIRNREQILDLIAREAPEAIIHCAAQPSHDLAARNPFADFDTNAVGTFNLLEAVRLHAPNAPFVLMSTNKVYGDAPNELPLVEHETRWDYADPAHYRGISEEMRIDRSLHSLFGASKLSADIVTQEYGRYFGIKTCSLRGGCLSGPAHSGVELHGFLSYLVKVAVTGGVYRVYGYKGKQVRDNIHSRDVCRAIEMFIQKPRPGEVYNLGGGRNNSCSIIEAAALVEKISGCKLDTVYVDENRLGDHICYISDTQKLERDYPGWRAKISLSEIVAEIVDAWKLRVDQGVVLSG